MDIKKIDKGLVVYNDRLGFLIVDEILDNERVSCNNGGVIAYARFLEEVTQEMLDDRYITQEDLDSHNAHI